MVKLCTDCGKEIRDGFLRCPLCATAKDVTLDKRSTPAEENKKDFTKATGYTTEARSGDLTLPKTVNTSNPALKDAMKQLYSASDPTNWIVFEFEGATDKLQVLTTGTDGLDGLKAKLASWIPKVLFGALLVIANSGESGAASLRTDKVVYFTFTGAGVPEMLRAQANVLKRQVQPLFGSVSLTLDLDGNHLDTLNTNSVGFKLLHGSGSHKSNFFDFGGPNGKVATSSFSNADEREDSEGDFD